MGFRFVYGLVITVGVVFRTVSSIDNEFTYSEETDGSFRSLESMRQSAERMKIDQLTLVVSNFQLGQDLLESFPNLKKIFMFNHYKSQNVSVAKNAFTASPQLQTIYVQNVNFSESGLPTLTGAKSLKDLMMFYEDLRQPVTGAQLSGTNLTSFVISGSPKVTLSDDVFDQSSQLDLIDVYQCSQIKLPKSIATLRRLTSLKFTYCALDSFTSDDVRDSAATLEVLDLSANRLTALDPKVFSGMIKLKVLSLARNQLTTVHSEWFEHTQSLMSLELNTNRIAGLPSGAFATLPRLRYLTLSNNSIDSLENVGLEAIANSSYVLDASSNRIDRLNLPKFSGNTSLVLRENRIRTIDRNSFADGSAFSNINIDGNPIDTIDDGAFADVSIDGSFWIANTDLVHFSIGVLDRMRSITKFRLFNNPKLVSINQSDSARLTLPISLKLIEIVDNPLLRFDDPNGYFERLAADNKITFEFSGPITCDCFLKSRFAKEGNSSSIFDLSHWQRAKCSNINNISVSQFANEIDHHCRCQTVDQQSPSLCSGAPTGSSFYGIWTLIAFLCVLFVHGMK